MNDSFSLTTHVLGTVSEQSRHLLCYLDTNMRKRTSMQRGNSAILHPPYMTGGGGQSPVEEYRGRDGEVPVLPSGKDTKKRFNSGLESKLLSIHTLLLPSSV